MLELLIYIQIASFSMGFASLVVSIIYYLKYRNRTVLFYMVFLLIFTLRVILFGLLFSVRLDRSVYYITTMVLYNLIEDLSRLFLFFIPAMLMHLLALKYEKGGIITVTIFALTTAAAFSIPYLFSGTITGGALLFSILEWFTSGVQILIAVSLPVIAVVYRKNIVKNEIVSWMLWAALIFYYGFLIFDWFSSRIAGGYLDMGNIGGLVFQLSFYFLLNLFFLIITIRFFPRFPETSPLNEPGKAFYEKYGISGREQEILLLILRGLNNREMSDKLFISPKTVKNHIHHIYSKTHVNSRMELAFLIRSVN